MPTMHPQQRRRGGQPGNKNASKADFYAANLSPEELADLRVKETGLLAEEIAVMRVLIRRVLAFCYDSHSSLGNTLDIMRAVTDSSLALAKIIQINHKVQPEEDKDAILRILTEKMLRQEAEQTAAAGEGEPQPAAQPADDDDPIEIPTPYGPLRIPRLHFDENEAE